MTAYFTSTGYTRLIRSLVRFCAMKRNEALLFVNLCARANHEAFTSAPLSERTGKIEKITLDLWDSSTPYFTEIQLYKALQCLYENMVGGCTVEVLQEVHSHLRAISNDIADRFRICFNVSIEDKLTVYSQCEYSLNPVHEPMVCFLDDWEHLWKGGV